MATKRKTEPRVFFAFTKSYKLRYIAHAAEADADKTMCGRDAQKVSTTRFDEEAEGTCKRCVHKLTIERRIHPGWDE